MTQSALHYDRSIAIDESLFSVAGIGEYEYLEIYELANGERFAAYAIQAERDLEVISVNGASARKMAPDRSLNCSQLQHPDRVRAETLQGPYRVCGCTNGIRCGAYRHPPQLAT